MNIAEQLVVFFISWWLVLLIVLPIGVRTVEEEGEKVEPGSVSSAPSKPRLLMKMAITTVIAGLILLLFRIVDEYDLITIKDMYN